MLHPPVEPPHHDNRKGLSLRELTHQLKINRLVQLGEMLLMSALQFHYAVPFLKEGTQTTCY
ncbi:MAG: hypothetical protein PVSMB5_13080 [Ktedonobacteraceae bacterium]